MHILPWVIKMYELLNTQFLRAKGITSPLVMVMRFKRASISWNVFVAFYWLAGKWLRIPNRQSREKKKLSWSIAVYKKNFQSIVLESAIPFAHRNWVFFVRSYLSLSTQFVPDLFNCLKKFPITSSFLFFCCVSHFSLFLETHLLSPHIEKKPPLIKKPAVPTLYSP